MILLSIEPGCESCPALVMCGLGTLDLIISLLIKISQKLPIHGFPRFMYNIQYDSWMKDVGFHIRLRESLAAPDLLETS